MFHDGVSIVDCDVMRIMMMKTDDRANVGWEAR
jgi:hypothetical protein